MQNAFLGTIRSHYNGFTKAEKRVADYILQYPQKVLFQSITELAEACGVGDTSVFRFCRTMGVQGYQEFKMRLSLSMHELPSPDEQAQAEGASLSELVNHTLKRHVDALQETAALVEPTVLNEAVDVLVQAKRIVFFGVGASLTCAMKAANKFMRIEPKVSCQMDAHNQAMQAATLEKGDAAVVISYSGSTRDTLAVARLAKESGAKIVGITRFVKSPLSAYTDFVLLCATNEDPLQGGSVGADICQSFLIDLLYTEYYRRNKGSRAMNTRTSSAVLDKLY